MLYGGITYTSPLLLNRDELISEWKFFRRAFHKEKCWQLRQNSLKNPATFCFLCRQLMHFPQMFTLLDILMAMPIGTATVEVIQSNEIDKTRLRNRLSDINLCCLVRIAVEGQELNEVNFEEIVDVLKNTTGA